MHTKLPSGAKGLIFKAFTDFYTLCMLYGMSIKDILYGPRREKTCLQGVLQSEFQTSLLSYRD